MDVTYHVIFHLYEHTEFTITPAAADTVMFEQKLIFPP